MTLEHETSKSQPVKIVSNETLKMFVSIWSEFGQRISKKAKSDDNLDKTEQSGNAVISLPSIS